jgi:hypothetical protein
VPRYALLEAMIMATVTAAARQTFREIHGVVVSAGLMQKTVKVRVGGQRWNKQVKKVWLPQAPCLQTFGEVLRR